MKKFTLPLIILLLVLSFDQVLKIYVKTNLYLGEEFDVLGKWFRIHFIENNGMAFGLEIAGDYGKVILSLFRIIACIAIIWYLNDLIKKGAPTGLVISITFILAGAIGNIIDSAFYGMFFSDSYHYEVAKTFPPEGGYAKFLYGRVVDMLYFPIIDTYLPDWFPFWPNRHVIFFRPVFNIADASITSGVASILIFHRGYFKTNE